MLFNQLFNKVYSIIDSQIIQTVHSILVVPKSTTHEEYDDNFLGKPSAGDEYREPRLSNPLVASTVDDFVPDDNDYETFLVDENTSPAQHLSIDPFAKSNPMKISVTDECVIWMNNLREKTDLD